MAVKLSFDVPETLELQFAEGLKVSSKYSGDQIMFSLTNGEKFYTDEFVASKIKAAGIGANQPFNIVKRAIVSGNRRMVEYEIEALLEPATVADPRPTVYAGESRDGGSARRGCFRDCAGGRGSSFLGRGYENGWYRRGGCGARN
jgi:hypothetical protein